MTNEEGSVKKNTISFTYEDEDGEEIEVELPTRWTICSQCRGNGTHVNPNIDGHGITAEEWERDWDDESREMYFSGGYDVACYAGCENGKIRDVDYECLSEEMKKRWDDHCEQQAQWAAEDAYTRRMESGGRD